MPFRSLVAGALLAGAALVALPGDALSNTQRSGGGSLQVLSGCDGAWSGIYRIRTRARFAGMPGNDPRNTRLSVFTDRYAAHFDYVAGAPPNVWQTANAAGWIGSLAFYGTLRPQPSLRLLAVPAGARNDGEVYVRLEVNDFDQLPNCLVRIDAVFRDR